MSHDTYDAAGVMRPLEVDTPALRLTARAVPWDSESFGLSVAQVDRIDVHDDVGAMHDLHTLRDWLDRGGFALASCRLEHDRLHESFALEAIGFRFVEMVYAMEVATEASAGVDDASTPVWRVAESADLPELQRIATSAFLTGRWNIDWRVGPTLGGARYADWVRRSLDNPHHEVLKAVDVSGTIVAFFIVESRVDASVYWHLTAVSPDFQGRGLGRVLWGSMVRRCAERGARRIATMISVRNVPVVNLYARLGWRFVGCQTTFQWVRNDVCTPVDTPRQHPR